MYISIRTYPEKTLSTREGRDSQLGMPKLLLPAIQVNMRAGEFPEPEENGIRFLKIPLNTV